LCKKKRDLLYIKEVCNNVEKVVESLGKEQCNEYVYRLIPSKYGAENIIIKDKNIKINSDFIVNLFD